MTGVLLRMGGIFLLCSVPCLSQGLQLNQPNPSAKQQATTDAPLKDNFIISGKMHYGFLWAHHTKMDYLVKGHVPAFEISLGKQTSGNQFWEQLYNYPAIGVSFLHFNLANPDNLGNANGVLGYVNFPLIRKKKFMWSYRFGTGIGVVDKPFDRITNYKNSAIGSQLNILITLLTETKWTLSKNLSLSTGIGLTHFSNGAFKTPNLGINLPTVNIGASWHPSTSLRGEPHANFKRDTLPKIGKEIEYSLIAAFGIKEIDPVGGSKYAVYTLSGNITKAVSMKRKLGIGLDIFYDRSNIKRYQPDSSGNNVLTGKESEFIRPGIHFAHELVISKLTAITQMGVYFYTKLKGDGYIYHRFALRYILSEHIFVNLSLKTHWAKADFIEWGLGYKVKSKKFNGIH